MRDVRRFAAKVERLRRMMAITMKQAMTRSQSRKTTLSCFIVTSMPTPMRLTSPFPYQILTQPLPSLADLSAASTNCIVRRPSRA